MPMSYKGNQEKLTNRGITVTCANGGQLVSTATDIINFHGIPTAAKKCHKFPNHQLVDPLLSLGKLTEHGCNVNFKKNTVEVTNSAGITILVGQKPLGRNIYTVPLPLGQPKNIPQDISVKDPKISVKVPKIRGVTAATALTTAAAAINHSKVIIQPKLIKKSPKSDYKLIIPTKLINNEPESDYKVIIPTKLTNKGHSAPEKMMISPTGTELFIATPEVTLNSPKRTPNGPKLIKLGHKTPLKIGVSSRNKSDGLKIYQADPGNLFSGPKTSKLLMKPAILIKESKNTLKVTRRTSDKKLLLPPPRVQKLNIPTPKCTFLRQNINNHNIKMTSEELKQYCEWVSGDSIKARSKVQEASLVQQTPCCGTNFSPYIPTYISILMVPISDILKTN